MTKVIRELNFIVTEDGYGFKVGPDLDTGCYVQITPSSDSSSEYHGMDRRGLIISPDMAMALGNALIDMVLELKSKS